MLTIIRLAMVTVFWNTTMCANMTLKVRGDSNSVGYYKEIEIQENISEMIMKNIFIGPSASFSLPYHGEISSDLRFIVSNINFFQVKNDTFFKFWHQANIQSVTCELQTMDQCLSTLLNKSCCSHRNAFLWNTTSEFLLSPKIKNITLNCGNETYQQTLFVYERLQIVPSSTTPNMTLLPSTTLILRYEDQNDFTGLIIGIVIAVIFVVVLMIVGFIIWNRRKKQKIINNNTALNESRLEDSERIGQRNVPNPYNILTSVNNMTVNEKNTFKVVSSDNVDFKFPQEINTTANKSNYSEPQTSEGYCNGDDYDMPRRFTLYENNSSSHYQVPQFTDEYKTINSLELETPVNKNLDKPDEDATNNYLTIVDTDENHEILQRDDVTAKEL